MADLWLPGFTKRPLKAGGPYDETAHPKLGWHTWEGLSWSGAEDAFRRYPPHIGCKPPHPGVPAADVGKRQYVPLDKHSYSFAGSESDDEYIIQVEVAGRAADAIAWTDLVCEWLYEEIVEPLERAVGIPPIVVPGGFFDLTNYHPANPANYLASARSEIRLTADELRRFSGHLGHQHMPPPDTHHDPGRIPIDRILGYGHPDQGDPLMGAAEEILAKLDDVETLARVLVKSLEGDDTGLKELGRDRGSIRTLIKQLIPTAAAGDDLDEAKVAQLVLAGLDPTAIAKAIPADIAEQVADILHARLAG